MLGDVWRWAGRFRTSERNIGIDYWQIPIALRQLLDDTKAWIEYKTYPHDEIAVRFHHRLVQIHPFPNGNGRHSRFIADLLAIQLGRERFSWGRERLRDAGAARERYIEPCAPLTITTSVLCWRSRGHRCFSKLENCGQSGIPHIAEARYGSCLNIVACPKECCPRRRLAQARRCDRRIPGSRHLRQTRRERLASRSCCARVWRG